MDCIEILKRLVEVDTTNPPGGEKPAAKMLAELLTPEGFRCEVQDLGDNRANLIAVIGSDDGPEMMFNGHLDVVPAVGNWEKEPFTLTKDGELLYGRGTSDMKGGIAAMCEAAIRVARAGGPEKGRLKLLFVADEECSNLGITSYFQKYGASDYAILGEPTDMQVAVAHRGVSRDYIDIFGPARHAALPEIEESAVTKAALAIQAVAEMNLKLKAVKHEVLPPPGIAVTMLEGYEKDNVVPGNVRLLLDFRILPEMTHEQVAEILDKGFAEAGLKEYKRSLHFFMPGGEISSQDDFVKLCLEEGEKQFGDKRRACAFDASGEQCFLVAHGIKAVICGPGSIAQAHTVDEFIRERDVRDAVEYYERVIRRVLG